MTRFVAPGPLVDVYKRQLQYCLGIAFPIEQCLPLSHHTQHLIVDDHLDDGNVVTAPYFLPGFAFISGDN